MLRRALIPGFAVITIVCGWGCESPTLPLPPPAAPTVLAGPDADHVDLVSGTAGGAESGALIVIENENPTLTGSDVGVVTRADDSGRWQAEVYAHNGDVLAIWQEFGAVSSPSQTVQVELP
jgi:hypothetical protein